MRTLLHLPFDPPSRRIRLILQEKGLPARLVETRPWEDREALAAQNPAQTIPVLIDEAPTGGEIAICPASAIGEYLEEAYGGASAPLLPATSAGRAEVRRLIAWFDEKFEADINVRTIRPFIEGPSRHVGFSKAEEHRAAADAIAWHLDYLSFLLERRAWLACDRMTAADLAGAAHLSANDYFGIIPWAQFPDVKEWYARLKSRPSMRSLLADRAPGASPARQYADLDF